MKVVLCYKEFELGELTIEDQYVFTPIGGCQLAKQKYLIPRASALLSGGVKKSDKLFPEFAYFFKILDNAYIKSEANIIGDETDYEKLLKIAKLELDKGSFYLRYRN